VWNHAIYVNELNIISMSTACQQEFGYYYALIRSKIDNHRENPVNEIILTLVRALLLELCHLFEQLDGNMSEQKMSQGKVLFNKFLSLVSNSDVKRQPITYYASQLAITPKYLTMLCLKYSNKTASQWVIQYTIEDIRFYLLNSHLSIKEISAKLGFANMSHFGSYVRKHLGVSPSEFRGQQ
jgi:AraC-like DNA-binding protein